MPAVHGFSDTSAYNDKVRGDNPYQHIPNHAPLSRHQILQLRPNCSFC